MSDELLIGAVMRNIYASPAADLLQQRASEYYVFGEVRIADFEITTAMTDEGAFIGMLTARLTATLDDMAELITMSTLPVHDEPPPEWLRKCWAL